MTNADLLAMRLAGFDRVEVTGQATSPVHDFAALRGTLSAPPRPNTAEEGDEGAVYFKLWPDDGQPDPDGSGKIWFRAAGVQSITVLEYGGVPRYLVYGLACPEVPCFRDELPADYFDGCNRRMAVAVDLWERRRYFGGEWEKIT